MNAEYACGTSVWKLRQGGILALPRDPNFSTDKAKDFIRQKEARRNPAYTRQASLQTNEKDETQASWMKAAVWAGGSFGR